MILSHVVLCCDVPSCPARLQWESNEFQPRSVIRILEDGRRAGWWVDRLGRAWCPQHTSSKEETNGPA